MSSSIGSSTLVSYHASSSSSSIDDEAGGIVVSGSSSITIGSVSDGRTATCSSCGVSGVAGVFLGFPIDVADGSEELVQVLEQIVAARLVVCH